MSPRHPIPPSAGSGRGRGSPAFEAASLRLFAAFALAAALTLGAALPSTALHAQSPGELEEALAGLEWREIGPVNMGGRVTAIHGIPGDPDVFWFGGADGGVWKTENGGVTFEAQWEDHETHSVGALAVAPSDRNVVWLGSGEGDPRNSVAYGLGVWRSTDGGDTWTHLGLEGTERIKRIVVDPRDPDVALVCAMGREWGPNEERGVFKTTDGGESWEKVLYIDEDTGCSDMDLDLSNPRHLYAGMWTFRRRPWRFDGGGGETALSISRDMGETWSKVETLPDEPMARPGVAVAQSNPEVVYLITEYPTAGTLFRSEDRGETWEMVNDNRNINFRPFYYSDVYVDPTNEDILYTLSGGLFKSTDGGRNFERIGRTTHGDHQAFWIDPENSDRLLSGSDGGYQVSHDQGESFHIWRNVVLSQFYHIFVDDRDPYWVCGGLQDNGNWCGPSRTRTPQGILPDEWYTVSFGDGFYTVPVPGQPHLVYSNAQGGYFYTTDTRSWTTRNAEPYPRFVGSQGQSMLQARYRFHWDAPIHISPHDPGTVYWGGNVLFKSTDFAHSWEIISPDLTDDDPERQRDSGGPVYNDNTAAEFYNTILTIAESPVEEGVIWIGTDDGNVQITRDGGETWTNVRGNVPGLHEDGWAGNIEASPTEPGTAFLAVDNHRLDDFTPHLWVTTDYGESWTDLSAGLPQDDYVKVVRQHPDNPDFLVVGMERGIQASIDRGETWFDLRLGLPPVSVRGVKIQEQYNDLVIGTHGRGAFILDDLGPLVHLAEATGTDVHLFPVRRATDWESTNRDTNLGDSFYRGENPEEGAYVNFWLGEGVLSSLVAEDGAGGNGRAASGSPGAGEDNGAAPVRVRITKPDGRLVREIDVEEPRAGVNRVVWDLRWASAEPVEGEESGPSFFGPSGPPAAPGTYTASLVAGDRELSTEFEVRGDPAVEISRADYVAREEAALRARDVETRINRMINAIQDMKAQVEATLEAVEGKSVANAEEVRRTGEEALEQLDSLEFQLHRPPPDMRYRQWPRLSEQLSFVNRGIVGGQARPTEGHLQAAGEIESDTGDREADLRSLIDTTISELNSLLQGQGRILTEWSPGRPVSE